MGHSTDFLGHIEIEPPLNDAEIEYLTAFFGSRRCWREGGPYDVPGNPRAESLDGAWGERATSSRPASRTSGATGRCAGRAAA